MRRTLSFIVIFIAASGFTHSQAQIDVKGIWEGKLQAGVELRILFHISMSEDGSLSATMDSPDQGVKGIPVEKVTLEGNTLVIEMPSVGGRYDGKVQEDAKRIEGTWKQSGMTFPLDLERLEEMPKVNRPQEPERPYPYIDEDVVYRNEEAGITLSGTLTFPKEGGPFPAVILVSGSGPQDRDETVFEHRPFFVLSDFLTRLGIAVLRVDDRGVGGSTGSVLGATSEDFAGDVLSGIDFLKTRPEIDPVRIGLVGHSEGGIVAPLVAAQSADAAFIVLMAGTGLKGEEILYLQSRLIMKANGATDEAAAENNRTQERMFRIVKEETDDAVARARLRKVLQESIDEIPAAQRENLGNVEMYIRSQVEQVMNPWFRFFLTYDPTTALRKVRCPVLAVNGELDLQVPPEENLTVIEKALKESGNADVTVRVLPGLNHLFQTATTGSPLEYGRIEETISPAALELIGSWIKEKTGMNNR